MRIAQGQKTWWSSVNAYLHLMLAIMFHGMVATATMQEQAQARPQTRRYCCCIAASGAYIPGASSMHQPGTNGSQMRQEADKPPQHMPATSYIIFSNLPKLEAIRSKLCEFNSMLSASPEKASLTLGETDVAPGGTLDSVLARCDRASISKRTHNVRVALWPPGQWAAVPSPFALLGRFVSQECQKHVPERHPQKCSLNPVNCS